MQDFDLTEFAKMFDAALVSDNPAVKKALRNFMMVSALVHAQEDGDERIMGPLETLVRKVGNLEHMVKELQYNRTTTSYSKDYYNNLTWAPTSTVPTDYISTIDTSVYGTLKDYTVTNKAYTTTKTTSKKGTNE